MPIQNSKAVCSVIELPLNSHMDTLITFGSDLLEIEADEVLVTGSELADVYDAACKVANE